MTTPDPAVEAVAEAIWAAVDNKGIQGRIYRQDVTLLARVAVAAARAVGVQDLFPDVTVLGEGQCCPDVCNGGACETCPSCCAGWCINGHDFTEGVWESMSEEDRRIWLDVASEHSPALVVSRPHIERETLRRAADRIDLSGYYAPNMKGRVSSECLNAESAAESWLREWADR